MGEAADALFGAYIGIMYMSWESASAAFNTGQEALFYDYLIDALGEHESDAEDDWPNGAGPAEYEDTMYGAYDEDVMERAFSDTIEEPVDSMDEIQQMAQEIDQIEEVADFFGDF